MAGPRADGNIGPVCGSICDDGVITCCSFCCCCAGSIPCCWASGYMGIEAGCVSGSAEDMRSKGIHSSLTAIFTAPHFAPLPPLPRITAVVGAVVAAVPTITAPPTATTVFLCRPSVPLHGTHTHTHTHSRTLTQGSTPGQALTLPFVAPQRPQHTSQHTAPHSLLTSKRRLPAGLLFSSDSFPRIPPPSHSPGPHHRQHGAGRNQRRFPPSPSPRHTRGLSGRQSGKQCSPTVPQKTHRQPRQQPSN